MPPYPIRSSRKKLISNFNFFSSVIFRLGTMKIIIESYRFEYIATIIPNCYWQLCNKFCNHSSTLILLINRRVTSPRPRKESPETERNSSADYFRRRCVDGTGCWIKSVKRNLREFFFRLAWRTRKGRQKERKKKLVGESATFAPRPTFVTTARKPSSTKRPASLCTI